MGLSGSVTKWIIAIVVLTTSIVDACNSYGHYGSSVVDFSHLDNLDASHHPTLSEKIRSVVRSHYGKGWGWSPPKSSYQGHSGGGDSYSHSAGGGGGESDGHHHLSSISSHSSHHKPGYEFAAHNHQKPVIVGPPKSKNAEGMSRKYRKVKVVQVKKLNE
ncbi:uncharacterized protein LOC110841939 [Folsomia candida]|nr:uncharacterized protein LOC110841939 [Folsomia candida]